MTDIKAAAAVAIMAAVTALLRFAPFVLLKDPNKVPPILHFLGKVLPCAIMGMLVVFCLKDVSFSSAAGFVPALCAGLLTALLQIWRKNTLLSIALGTACYMVLVQAVFP